MTENLHKLKKRVSRGEISPMHALDLLVTERLKCGVQKPTTLEVWFGKKIAREWGRGNNPLLRKLK